MKRIIKIVAILALVALVIIQFIRPEKNDGGYQSLQAFEQETKPSDEVLAVLKSHCYDCHSDQTKYPWYAEIAPVSFWLDEHIEHGKGHFNASEWTSYSLKKKDHKLEELIEMVEEEEMPLPSFTWIHGDITEEQRELLIQWATLVRNSYRTELEGVE